MKRIVRLALSTCLFFGASSAFADYTTTITSAAYNTANTGTPTGTYKGSMSMSGQVVVDESFVPGSAETWIDFSTYVISYSFSDGVQTFTQDNSFLENAEAYFDGGFTMTGLDIGVITPTPHSIGTLINVLEFEIEPFDVNYLVVGNDIPCTAVIDGLCDDGDVDAAAGFADLPDIAISFSTVVTEPTPPAASAAAVPTMSAYGLILTMLGLLIVAGRRLRTSAKRD
jgi:hypothetical protein